jgi:hypothetical protein
MPKFKKIFDNNCAFGGHECHVTSDGVTVNIKHRHAPSSSTFKIVARMSVAHWEEFAHAFELSNPYQQNPAILVRAFCNSN